MAGLTVGTPAPAFRLPSGQGPEVALETFRGKKNVVVWFTKGMGCPFCRAQMSRLARIYPELQKREAEVLEVTTSNPRRAKTYASKFPIPFPYLADPDYEVHRQWGLGYRSNGPMYYVKGVLSGPPKNPPPNDFGDFMPALTELPAILTDDDMGFFIVDKAGIVRYALSGSYVVPKGDGFADRELPSNEEILREIERCGTPSG
jgi:peroxiredoxin